MSYELKDFRTEVVDASIRHPVLVDFWAPWCGPCKTLTPVLEKLVEEAKGAWTLVKINVDENGPIAGQFGVQGIPAVFLVYQGAVLGNFTGMQTEETVRKWLGDHLPEGTEPELEEEAPAVEADDIQALEANMNENPEDVAAKWAYAVAIVFSDPAKASAALAGIPETAPEHDQAQHLLWLAEDLAKDPVDLPAHDKIKPHYLAALTALRNSDFEAALDAYLEVLYRDRSYAEDGARKGILGIFAFLGRHHEIPTKYYRRFEMALF